MIKKQTNPKSIIPKPRARSTLERFGINQGASTPVASNLISNLKKGTADFLKIVSNFQPSLNPYLDWNFSFKNQGGFRFVRSPSKDCEQTEG